MSMDAAGLTTQTEILSASLTEVQARDIYRQGEEAVVFALLTFARKLGELQPTKPTPTPPSGMIPPYQKPPATRRRKSPGRKAGHPGSRRPPPEQIDRRQEHRLPRCPHCGGRLRRCTDTRTRYIEDIPHGIQPVVTEHVIHRDWCPHCRKQVEPVVPDALSGATLGNRTLVLSAWLHYGLGNTLSQSVEVFNYHLQLPLTQGCLVHLLRDLETVERYSRGGKHWPAFAKKLRRLLGDAIRLWRQEGLSPETFASRRRRLDQRLDELIETPSDDGQARRLIKRLRRHRDDLFTFLDRPGVPFDNNLGERAIRPAVIIRKNSYANRSQRGADAQAVLMSIYRTLKQRGHDPLTTITNAIATYLTTGQLPQLPPKITSDG